MIILHDITLLLNHSSEEQDHSIAPFSEAPSYAPFPWLGKKGQFFSVKEPLLANAVYSKVVLPDLTEGKGGLVSTQR
jgi:hypothetical protein